MSLGPERNSEMPSEPAPNPVEAADAALHTLLASANASQPFGPGFFLSHLRGLVRDHCPSPGELPRVDLHLQSGEVLQVCHVVGVAPSFVALATAETAHPTSMRLEMIPYQVIIRVTLHNSGQESRGIGFDADRRPAIMIEPVASAEGLLSRAAQAARSETGGS